MGTCTYIPAFQRLRRSDTRASVPRYLECIFPSISSEHHASPRLRFKLVQLRIYAAKRKNGSRRSSREARFRRDEKYIEGGSYDLRPRYLTAWTLEAESRRDKYANRVEMKETSGDERTSSWVFKFFVFRIIEEHIDEMTTRIAG